MDGNALQYPQRTWTAPPYRPAISDRPRPFKMIPHARLFGKLRIRGPGAPGRYTHARFRRPTPPSKVKLRLIIRIPSFLVMRKPLIRISGLPRLQRLPELRGPPEAQGVARPFFGRRPPRFLFFPTMGHVLPCNTPFSSENPPGHPALNPIYSLDFVFYFLYILHSLKQTLFKELPGKEKPHDLDRDQHTAGSRCCHG
jgi:hypothetical protein